MTAVTVPAENQSLDRDQTIRLIREGLFRRTGIRFSVTGGRGTAWGWIRIDTMPKRQVCDHMAHSAEEIATFERHMSSPYSSCKGAECYKGFMPYAERVALGKALGLGKNAHFQGESVPAQSDFRRLYVALAQTGDSQGFGATRNWD